MLKQETDSLFLFNFISTRGKKNQFPEQKHHNFIYQGGNYDHRYSLSSMILITGYLDGSN